jgi:hypothetical protein
MAKWPCAEGQHEKSDGLGKNITFLTDRFVNAKSAVATST